MKNIRCKLAYVLECLVYIWNSFNKPDSADLIYVIILVVNKFKTMHLEMCETWKFCGKQETLFSWFPISYIIYYLLIWVIIFQIYFETLMLLILSELISWLLVTEFDQHFRKTPITTTQQNIYISSSGYGESNYTYLWNHFSGPLTSQR